MILSRRTGWVLSCALSLGAAALFALWFVLTLLAERK